MMRIKLLLVLFCLSGITSLLTAQSGHWELLEPEHHPAFRFRHGMAPIGENKVLLFGGKGNSEYLNDTWIFDLDRNDWDSIKCTNFPTPREEFGMCQLTDKKVLLFGGRSDLTETNSDLWLFDLDSMNWRELKPLNTTEGRYGLRMAKLNNSEVLVFGGIRPKFQTTVYSNDTRIYNIDSNKWTAIKYSVDVNYHLQPREAHFLENAGMDSVLLFGGGNPSINNELYKTWLYRKDLSWDSLNPMKNNINLIYAGDMRKVSGGKFLLFGGVSIMDSTYDTWYEGTWLFNLQSNSWNEMDLKVHPFGRYDHKMAQIDSNKVLLFGGIYKGSNGTVSPYETWLFTLDSMPTAVPDVNNISEIVISPNPASDYIEISYPPSEKRGSGGVSIFDLLGMVVTTPSNLTPSLSPGGEGSRVRLDVSHLSPGVYFVRFGDLVRKFVKI